MGADCSNCKCANGEEEKILIIPEADKHLTKERKAKLEKEKAQPAKSKVTLNKEILNEILEYNPGLESKIIKVQSLIRRYKDRNIYKVVLAKIRETQAYFTSEEAYETVTNSLFRESSSYSATYTYKSGAIYTGEWQGGFRHGFGKMRWQDGTLYEGFWNLGSAEGEGKLTYTNGNYMKGHFRHNKLNGHGECFNLEMNYKYVGTWVNDLQCGQGTETWPDGSQYLGLFENSNKERFGKYLWVDQSFYIGEWKDNKINGLVSNLYILNRVSTTGLMVENT